MGFKYAVCCDVHGCESSEPTALNSLPEGWRQVTTYRKATPDDVGYLGHMSPLLKKARETQKEVSGAVEEMIDSAVCSMPPVAESAIICSKHALPDMKSSPGPRIF